MIRLTPTEASRRDLDRFLDLADALSAPTREDMQPIQDVIRANFAANFAGEVGDDARWAPLAPRTVRERIARGYPGTHPILERSGEYRRSFVEGDHPQHYSRAEAAGGRWLIEEGSTDERADRLEFGDYRTPARPVTLPGKRGEQRIETVIDLIFGEWFEEAQP